MSAADTVSYVAVGLACIVVGWNLWAHLRDLRRVRAEHAACFDPAAIEKTMHILNRENAKLLAEVLRLEAELKAARGGNWNGKVLDPLPPIYTAKGVRWVPRGGDKS